MAVISSILILRLLELIVDVEIRVDFEGQTLILHRVSGPEPGSKVPQTRVQSRMGES